MGCNKTPQDTMSFGYSSDFPAFLTYRTCVYISCVDMIQAAFYKGMRAESFANMLLELHTKKYHRGYLEREYELEQFQLIGVNINEQGIFSRFGNKSEYNSGLPQ